MSRLRRAGLSFSSVLPDSDVTDCDLVLTTEEESERFGPKALALECLDENPGIFKGQLISRLEGEDDLLVGVDPGKRTGMAVFYGRTKLSSSTFDSGAALYSRIRAFADAVPSGRVLVRIGNGNRSMTERMVERIRMEIPGAAIELVDESGTSVRTPKMKGVQKDQVAAAKIAFRKGEAVTRATRNHD